MSNTGLSRRDLCLGCGALFALAGCGEKSDPEPASDGAMEQPDLAIPADMAPPSMVPGGAAADVPVGGAKLLPGAIFLCRDASGLYAITGICTHQGCEVEFFQMPPLFTCPCHGSQFDFNGAVVNGPALRRLVHFMVTVDAAGDVFVDRSKVVPPATRV